MFHLVDYVFVPERVTLSDDGAWCWFQDPRALRRTGDNDRTFAGWVTSGGDIVVGQYDHEADEVSRTTLHRDFEPDDHDAPAIYIDADGHILVFYTAHGGPKIYYRRSEAAEDITEFGLRRTIAPSGSHTYMDPRRLDDQLYLFYRNENGGIAYIESNDEGGTWSDESELITTDGLDWCVYQKCSAVRDGRVDFGLTYAVGGGNAPHRDVRHVRFDGNQLTTAAGKPVADGKMATFWDAPVVYDSDKTGNDAWIWDCSVVDGIPQLVYTELRSEDDHVYRYARWTGEEWINFHLADSGSYITRDNNETYYSGGVVLDHDCPGVCYYSQGNHDGSELVRAETDDGEMWQRTTITDEGVQNVRPVVPRNHHDDLPVLWMRGNYTNYFGHEYDTEIVGPANRT